MLLGLEIYTVGNVKTGVTVYREKEYINGILIKDEDAEDILTVKRFVGSFPKESAIKVLEKFIGEDPELKVYHNFDWYRNRLEVIEEFEKCETQS